jgi:acetolactate synthase-1/2/3 large subunit
MMRAAFEAADLVILIGFDLMEFEPQYWNFGTPKKVAYIAAVPCDRASGFRPDLEAIGDIGRSLKALDGGRSEETWTSGLKRRLEDLLATVPEQTNGVKPQAIVRAIRNALGRDDIVVSDVGAHLLWMAQRYPVYRENTLLMSNGLIPMGVGVPWAIAAKLTHPERKVVASVGDGSFAMTSMELETAKRLGTPFVTVVWDDSELALIRIKQQMAFGRDHGIAFSNPDIMKYAESLGATGYRVASNEELEDTLTHCLKDDELAVIDVPVDGRESNNLLPG